MKGGKLIIITAPSGGGKTTIVKHLLQNTPGLAFSVSATTRPKRENETDGKDYYFLTLEEFRKKIDTEEFVEWEEVYPGKYYGTLKSELNRLWAAGKNIIFDVDVKGALNLKNQFPKRTISIFIKPPSIEVLIERLTKRATESPETLTARIERINYELTFEDQFDHVIINDKLDSSLSMAYTLVHNFCVD
ncbi:MAG: guanylate kinase [Chitinophagales bacterium]